MPHNLSYRLWLIDRALRLYINLRHKSTCISKWKGDRGTPRRWNRSWNSKLFKQCKLLALKLGCKYTRFSELPRDNWLDLKLVKYGQYCPSTGGQEQKEKMTVWRISKIMPQKIAIHFPLMELIVHSSPLLKSSIHFFSKSTRVNSFFRTIWFMSS